MAKSYYLTTNALTALSDPNAILATPLNLFSSAQRYGDSGTATSDVTDISSKNIHTITIKSGNSTSDSLSGTSGDDVVFWDFQTLAGISISLSLLSRTGLPTTDQNVVIERFDLGDGNDVINLTHNASLSFAAYSADATILGGAGDDVVWSGAGNDSIFGGTGLDWIDGGAGNDTLYGGTEADTVVGGSGDDRLFIDGAVASLDAGTGSDYVQFDLNLPSYQSSALVAGPNDVSDGNDQIFTHGSYGAISISLGGGADLFIGSAAAAGANDSDVVDGQDGNDLIATYDGNDTVFGGSGDDVLWGGAGTDSIFGGEGSDIIYPGFGTGDVMYGGPGTDYFYLTRGDGAGNQIYDLVREGQPSDGMPNMLIVGGDPAPNETGGDFILDGTGVRETDHNIMDNAGGDDTVQVHQVAGTVYELDVIGGGGTQGMTVQFDVRDVPNIVLWDNDSTAGPVQQLYVWDGSQYTFAA